MRGIRSLHISSVGIYYIAFSCVDSVGIQIPSSSTHKTLEHKYYYLLVLDYVGMIHAFQHIAGRLFITAIATSSINTYAIQQKKSYML